MKITIIIAEAGVNHNGKIDIAKKLILKAKNIGADYIKFQLYEPDEISTKKAEKALYQKKYSHKEETQYGLLKRLHLNNDEMFKLYKYAKKKRIGFLLSVFDVKSLEFLEKIKLDYLKIPSGEINNLPFLITVKKLQKNIILSTGMANLKEIKTAYKLLKNETTKSVMIELDSNNQEDIKFVNEVMDNSGLKLLEKKHSKDYTPNKFKSVYNYLFSRY